MNDPKKGWTPDRVREHLQNAVVLELWTIPLYLTAAYSIQAPIDPTSKRPEVHSVPMKDDQPDFDSFSATDWNQYAFNSVLSVAIQEMLHLELAANLLNAVRPDQVIPEGSPWVRFTGEYAPTYNAPPPVINGALPPGVTLKLGPLDENQVKLFQWVEEERPPVGDPEAYQPAYDSIGNFYTALSFGLAVCWPELYPPKGCSTPPTAAELYQKNDWGEAFSKALQHGRIQTLLGLRMSPHLLAAAKSAANKATDGAYTVGDAWNYPFSIQVFGWPADAWIRAHAAMTAIKVQGEGAGEGEDVPTRFRPTTGDPIEIFLDGLSHYTRFTQLLEFLPHFTVYNEPVAPDLPQFQALLSQSYSSFLVSMETSFSGKDPVGISAMRGLGNRTLQVWQHGGTPEYQWVNPKSYVDPDRTHGWHACQGLDETGTCECATAFAHVCEQSSMCAGQGGCGYAGTVPEDDWKPGFNACQQKGGCGSPIPATQVFNWNTAWGTVAPEDLQDKDVWKEARALLRAKIGPSFPADDPPPNDLRLSLTPTAGPKPTTDEA